MLVVVSPGRLGRGGDLPGSSGQVFVRIPGRRAGAALLVFLASLLARPVHAGETSQADAAVQAASGDRVPIIGLMVDLGLPEIAGASLVVRPWRWLRAHAGASCDLISFGVRGGLAWVPFRGVFRPTLTIEGGHVFEGDANRVSRLFGLDSPALERVGYSHASAHLGFEIGNDDGFVFFLHGGASLLLSRIRNLQQVLQDETGDPSITFEDPLLQAWVPSAKLGFLYYF